MFSRVSSRGFTRWLLRHPRVVVPSLSFSPAAHCEAMRCCRGGGGGNHGGGRLDEGASLNERLTARVAALHKSFSPTEVPTARSVSPTPAAAGEPPEQNHNHPPDDTRAGAPPFSFVRQTRVSPSSSVGRRREPGYNRLLFTPAAPAAHTAVPNAAHDTSRGKARAGLHIISASESVEEVRPGILLYTNDADDLGFHLPPRYLLAGDTANRTARAAARASATTSVSNVALHGGEEEGEEEEDDIDAEPPASFRFGQPVTRFTVSPVVAAYGCLWQWRPLRVCLRATSPRRKLVHEWRTFLLEKQSHPRENGEDLLDGSECQHAEHLLASLSLPPTQFYMIPFLLCPVQMHLPAESIDANDVREEKRLAHALAETPYVHPAVVSALLQGGRQAPRSSRKVEATLAAFLAAHLTVSVPSALGEVPATVGPHPPSPPQSSASASPVAAAVLARRQAWVQQLLAMVVEHRAEAEAARQPQTRDNSGVSFTDDEGSTTLHEGESAGGVGLSASVEATADFIAGVLREDNSVPAAARAASTACPRTAAADVCHSSRDAVGGSRADGHCPSRSVEATRRANDGEVPVRGGKGAKLSAAAPLPLVYHNLLLGGLAELCISVDRYAALVARRELPFAAGCFAVLSDTKHTSALAQLLARHPGAVHDGSGVAGDAPGRSTGATDKRDGRLLSTAAGVSTPLTAAAAVERELMAAAASQRHLTALALQTNRTLVGKSGAGTVSLSGFQR